MKADKVLRRMREAPQGDWRIEDLRRIAVRYNIPYREGKGSHGVFDFGAVSLTVPAHRPIKAIYIRKFLRHLETLS